MSVVVFLFYFFSMFESRLGFFKRRMTMACLRTSRTVPDSRESLIMQVVRGTKLSIPAFRSPVKIG